MQMRLALVNQIKDFSKTETQGQGQKQGLNPQGQGQGQEPTIL